MAALAMPSLHASAAGESNRLDPGSDAGNAGRADDVDATSGAVATSVSFAVDLRAKVPGKTTVHLVVKGQMNFARHTVAAEVTVPTNARRTPASEADAQVDADADADTQVDAAAAPTQSPMTLHTEWVGQHAYLAVPASWTAMAKGAQIVSLPTSPSLRRTVDTALSQSAVALTYARLLLDDLTAHQSVHRLGSRTIDGVAASGAEVALTLHQLLKLVPELSPTMTKYASSMANQSIDASVWVDRQGRLVDVTLAPGKADDASITGAVRFSQYDATDRAAKPAATTVRPIPRAMRRLLGTLYYF
jgi:hypothetical protein